MSHSQLAKQVMAARAPSKRVLSLQKQIRESMRLPKQQFRPPDIIFNEVDPSVPLIIRKALAIKKKLETVPIGLWPGQLIAGSFTLHPKGITAGGGLPRYATDEELRRAAEEGLSPGSIVGHIVPHYPRLLKLGTTGVRELIDEKLQHNPKADSKPFYEACRICLEALELFAERHVQLLQDLAKDSLPAERREELRRMAANLEHSPTAPPSTFWEALNAVWLLHLAFQLTGNALALGRTDQYLYPFLKADLQAGRITPEKAQELVDCFLLKFNERSLDNRVRREQIDLDQAQKSMEQRWRKRTPFDHSTQRYNVRDSIDATNHWLQNIILGGVKPKNGCDAANLCTFLFLEGFRHNKMTNPVITVRLHENSPEELVTKICEVLPEGGGSPALFNDESIIPSLTAAGFPLTEARDYTNDGCWEVIVPGRTDFYFDRFNMLKCLEWTLNHGVSRMDGKKETPDPGDPREFASFEQLYDAFLGMLTYQIKGNMDKISRSFGRRATIAPTPLLSTFLEGPLEKGMDMTEGGARFVTYGLIAEGVSHVIDSLAALKQVVYDTGQASMAEVLEALDANFSGHERLRKLLQGAPKYGRNEEPADALGLRVIDDFTKEVNRLNSSYPRINFLPGVGTFSWYIAIGEGLGASPDGRLAGEPVASNFSPSAGVELRGVTGAILSHARLSGNRLPVGSPLDLKVNRRAVTGEEGQKRLAALLRSFVRLGGNMMTITVTDTDILRDAQKNPDAYPDLRVRMGGWSAYFVMLSRKQQDLHIRKQEL